MEDIEDNCYWCVGQNGVRRGLLRWETGDHELRSEVVRGY